MSSIRVYSNYDGSSFSYSSLSNVTYNRGDLLGFGYDLNGDGAYVINEKDYHYFSTAYESWYQKISDGTYSYIGTNISGIKISDITSTLQMHLIIYIKDDDGTYYEISSQFCTPFGGSSELLSSSDYQKYVSDDCTGPYSLYTSKIYYYTDYGWTWFSKGSKGFQVPDYAQYDTDTFFVDVYLEFNGTIYKEGDELPGAYRIFLANKTSLGKLSSDFKLDSTKTISYPTFCESSKSIISSPTMTNSTSVILYRSIDNGLNWTEIYNKENNTYSTVDEKHDWEIYCYDKNGTNYKKRTFSFYAIPPITLSYTDTDAINQSLTTTHGIKYKAIFTALGIKPTNATTLEIAPSTEMQVLDLTLPSSITFSEKANYLKGSNKTFSIAKSTVADPTRVKFRHIFAHTNLPNTITPSAATALQDGTPSMTENMGNWITTPNGTYEYRIIPILDGSECYTSSSNKNYKSISFIKAGHKLEAIRPIEMGSNKPVKIKLLTTPGKTEFPANSSVKFYVANNGNDTNIVWEELPNSCIGTPSNPNVDQFQFSNTTKTADTWKVMVKIVADKNTATTDFKLNSFTVIINGGEKDTSIPGYKYIANTVLTENATSVRIDIPQGYKKFRIICDVSHNGAESTYDSKILLNSISSGYSCQYIDTTYTSSKSISSCFLYLDSPSNSHFIIDLTYDNNAASWIGQSINYNGVKIKTSGCKYTMAAEDLQYLTINSNTPKGSEFTVMVVD